MGFSPRAGDIRLHIVCMSCSRKQERGANTGAEPPNLLVLTQRIHTERMSLHRQVRYDDSEPCLIVYTERFTAISCL